MGYSSSGVVFVGSKASKRSRPVLRLTIVQEGWADKGRVSIAHEEGHTSRKLTLR